MKRAKFTEFEKQIMQGTTLKKHFTNDVPDSTKTENVQNTSDDSVKVIANVSKETKALLDHANHLTGLKKGRIIENGIKLECDRLEELLNKKPFVQNLTLNIQ
ncbi:hypothetical protein [Ethanoligenens sp.]|uniref:hypothetical protein n=1 Tax=Ethanoligenens sp. TaxID=2099655 RepID=UPI0039EC4429